MLETTKVPLYGRSTSFARRARARGGHLKLVTKSQIKSENRGNHQTTNL
jgi:hypothetical protein